jgi:hypothetical protein
VRHNLSVLAGARRIPQPDRASALIARFFKEKLDDAGK